MICVVYRLGQVGYREACYLQAELLDRRVKGILRDTLLLLEHPPVVTVGKSGSPENILVSLAELAARGISVFFTDRGGDVTYHGPGQLVGYPIIDLRQRGRDLHRYVHDLEEVIIRTLDDFGITASRDSSHRGVWVANKEIAAVGLRMRKWVTMHGFALNINTDLAPFSLINPCGFSDRGATSMSALLGQEIPMAVVAERVVNRFAEVFNAEMESSDSLARLEENVIEVLRSEGDENQATVLV